MFCKKCGNDVGGAKFCPDCGTPSSERSKMPERAVKTTKRKKGCLPVFIGAVAIFVIINVIIANSTPAGTDDTSGGTNSSAVQPDGELTAAEKAMEGAVEVDYKQLHQDYMDNAIGADAKYKDKQLILTGTISDIDREIAGQPYVTFNIDDFLSSVRITFNKNEESKVAEFAKGQAVKVVGTCKGTILSTVVSLTDCYVIE